MSVKGALLARVLHKGKLEFVYLNISLDVSLDASFVRCD
jgi:uncharacterized protein related to proFAR isomerase